MYKKINVKGLHYVCEKVISFMRIDNIKSLIAYKVFSIEERHFRTKIKSSKGIKQNSVTYVHS